MNWYLGQKVVCVNDTPWSPHPFLVKRDSIYVIEGFDQLHKCLLHPTDVGLFLLGIESPSDILGPVGYAACRFRPLQELKDEARERARLKKPQFVPLKHNHETTHENTSSPSQE